MATEIQAAYLMRRRLRAARRARERAEAKVARLISALSKAQGELAEAHKAEDHAAYEDEPGMPTRSAALRGRRDHLGQADGVGEGLVERIEGRLLAHDGQLQHLGLAVLPGQRDEQLLIAPRSSALASAPRPSRRSSSALRAVLTREPDAVFEGSGVFMFVYEE